MLGVWLFVGLVIIARSADIADASGKPDESLVAEHAGEFLSEPHFDEKRFLLIYSYSLSFAPDFQIAQAFSQRLNASDLVFSIQNVELKTFLPEGSTVEAMDRELGGELENIRKGVYDVIIPFGQNAVDLLAHHGEDIPADTAVVFGGLELETQGLRKAHGNTTGTMGRVSIEENLLLGLRLFPRAKKVILLSNASTQGRRITETGRQLRVRYPHLSFDFPDNGVVRTNDLLEQIKKEDGRTLVLFYSWFNARSTTNLNSLDYLKAHLSDGLAPVFALQQPMLGWDAIGGVFSDTRVIGQELASQVLQILEQGSAAGMAMKTVPLVQVVQGRALSRGIISYAAVPDTAVILSDTPFVRKNIVLFAAVVVFLLLVIVILAVMLRQIWQNQKAQQAAQEAKSFFFASVSHDLRTPLNAVIGLSELLRDGVADEEERRHYLNSIIFSGNTLLQLINDVLDLSKLEANKMEFIPAACNFQMLTDNLLTAFTEKARQSGLTLESRVDRAMPPIEIDQQRVRQIIFNLLGNALKFTAVGGVCLSGSYDEETETLHFAVTDTGVGIAQSDIKLLMQPYVQLNQRDRTTGTGLGLSICQQMLSRMNGKMEIQSEIGKGSTFSVTMYGVHKVASAVKTENETKQEKQVEDLAILIADDSALNLEVLKAMCRRLGYKDVTAVASGQEALDELEKRPFDVLLSDRWMPGMNGDELVAKIRGDKRLREMPVVLFTADVEAMKIYKEQGFTDILLKPITKDTLKKMLVRIQGMTGGGAGNGNGEQAAQQG